MSNTAVTRAEVERVCRILCEVRGDNPDSIVSAQSDLPRNSSGRLIISGQPVQPAWCSFWHEAIAVLSAKTWEDMNV